MSKVMVTALSNVSAAKRCNMAMDRFSDFNLDVASYLKRERAGVTWAASSYNAFAIAMFSSLFYILY